MFTNVFNLPFPREEEQGLVRTVCNYVQTYAIEARTAGKAWAEMKKISQNHV